MYYFANKETRDFLQSRSERVYFYGSYDDPNNFGDIIQAKGAIYVHGIMHDREPVMFLSYRALKSEDYIQKLKQWFSCRYFVFVSDTKTPEVKWPQIAKISQVKQSALLHVYGGGYFNGMWGSWRIGELKDIIKHFSIGEYLLSGHQVDKNILPELSGLFEQKMPLLIGLRDKMSLQYIKDYNPKLPAYYSFDDVSEIFQNWIKDIKMGLRSRVAAKMNRQRFAIHMNMASYTGDEDHRADIVNAIRLVRMQYPNHLPAVLHSYNERRPEFTKDSLGTLIELQEDFPYHSYAVFNLAQMALSINPKNGYYPSLATSEIANIDFAITCSYHTAMLMSLLGKPAYLIASNDYYRQKRKGLGYPDDLGQFLEAPEKHTRDFREDLIARTEWLKLLKDSIL